MTDGKETILSPLASHLYFQLILPFKIINIKFKTKHQLLLIRNFFTVIFFLVSSEHDSELCT